MANGVADVMNVIREGNTARLDIGQVNESYFVNVLVSGLFSDVSCLTPGFLNDCWARQHTTCMF